MTETARCGFDKISPLKEGRSEKGGVNSVSQITVRPPAPRTPPTQAEINGACRMHAAVIAVPREDRTDEVLDMILFNLFGDAL